MNYLPSRTLVFCHDKLQSKVFYHCTIASLAHSSSFRLFIVFSDATVKNKVVRIAPFCIGLNLFRAKRRFRALYLISILKRINYGNLELIDTSLLSVIAVLFSVINGKPVFTWMRGYEARFTLNPNETRFIRPSLYILYLFISSRIIYKEPRHEQLLHLLKLKHKSTLIHNSTPIKLPRFNRETDLFKQRPLRFLFFNRAIQERNLIPFMSAVLKLADSRSLHISIEIIGLPPSMPSNESNYLRTIVNLASRINQIQGCSCLLSAYSRKTLDNYSGAHFFILPSVYTFANYSLLEAMSHGLIPLLTKSQWSARLVPNSMHELDLVDFENTQLAWENILSRILCFDSRMIQALSYQSWLHHKRHFSIGNSLVARYKHALAIN